MRISDWSSDVCSSDLERRHRALVRYELAKRRELVARSVYPQIGIAGPPIIVRPAYLLCAIPNGRIMREQHEKPRLPVRIASRIRCGGKQPVDPGEPRIGRLGEEKRCRNPRARLIGPPIARVTHNPMVEKIGRAHV